MLLFVSRFSKKKKVEQVPSCAAARIDNRLKTLFDFRVSAEEQRVYKFNNSGFGGKNFGVREKYLRFASRHFGVRKETLDPGEETLPLLLFIKKLCICFAEIWIRDQNIQFGGPKKKKMPFGLLKKKKTLVKLHDLNLGRRQNLIGPSH